MSTVEWEEAEIRELEEKDSEQYTLQDKLKLLDFYIEENGGKRLSSDEFVHESGDVLSLKNLQEEEHRYNDLLWLLGRDPNKEAKVSQKERRLRGSAHVRKLEHELGYPPSSTLTRQEYFINAPSLGYDSYEEMITDFGMSYYVTKKGPHSFSPEDEADVAGDVIDAVASGNLEHPSELYELDHSTEMINTVLDLYLGAPDEPRWADQMYWAEQMFGD